MKIEHFDTKKPHTEIKHKLFYDTFTAILGISSVFSKNNSFAYIDLYAGEGKFSDDTYGSPLLAYKAILDSTHLLNKFHEVKCYFSEANEDSAKELENNLKSLPIPYHVKNVKTNIEVGQWNHNSKTLNDYLKWSTWGFIFVDPFANEVSLDSIFPLIQEKCKKIDFMFFINTQAMKRIVGSDPNRQDIADFLGINLSDLKDTVKNDEKIRAALQKKVRETR